MTSLLFLLLPGTTKLQGVAMVEWIMLWDPSVSSKRPAIAPFNLSFFGNPVMRQSVSELAIHCKVTGVTGVVSSSPIRGAV